VDIDAYATGKHATTACAQCHTGVTVSKTRSCETITEPVDCSICHAERVTEFNTSTHGQYMAAGDPDAPTCLDCHSKHVTEDHRNPTSPTYPRNIPDLCAKCHQEGMKAAVRIETDIDDIFGSYNMSIHGKGLIESGLVVTATCVSCHTAHSELPPDDPGSSVHPDNVNKTCGACHHGIEEQFENSVHWPANHDDDFAKKLPTCEDCHSSHTISRTDSGDFQVMMMDQCGRCHEGEAETFFDTFHGKVSRLGASGAAACYDCHGTHNILPPSDPASMLSRDNVVTTCGSCHEGSHRRFAGYLTHATHHDMEKYPYLFFAFWGMTALLIGTMTFALLHTAAWLLRLYLSRDQWVHHKPKPGEKMYRRFNYRQRMLHLTMLLSFFVLAGTGMALKFSYMGWAQWSADVIGGFHTTGTLHRIAAVVLFAVFFLHLRQVNRHRKRNNLSWLGLVFSKNSMMFNKKDLQDFVGSMKWFLGIGPRPHYGRYTYWEKFDYFAVFWGVFIIGSTGLLLWFPEFFTRLLPGWSVNVATIIHSDEALLAVAFIFTVHFFNTHFRPDKFPMDPVIFTGRVPLEEFKADKPAEYEELVASGKLEEHLFERMPEPVERGFKIFGMTALAVGLTLIVLIVYSMLFGYQ
jgi:cytochrome b subunit of formate dehydrogenase/nitrate/TMAO reductase-like tetraheme cytochrome c subunit